jgi:hypothetical protein
MRFILATAAVLLPAVAFAQTAMGPTAPIPVQRCDRVASGVVCTPVQDGAAFAAADGYARVHGWDGAGGSQRAIASGAVQQPAFTR